jgi:predicted dienelactone hydrolase
VLVPVAVVMATSLLGAACSDAGGDSAEGSSTTTSSTTTTEATAPDPDLAPPDEPGPYGVGRQVIELEDADRGRPLVADVWYPVDPDTTGEPSVYSFLPGIEFASETALADVPVSDEGPFPLVVYSHGSGGLRYVASFFTELLASHGFVVVAVDHVGNTAVELVTGDEPPRDQVSLDRVLDVQFVIDEMLAASQQADDAFADSIDPERIGVTGHSYGGFTTFASVSGFSNELGEATGDDRIDALVAMAPASELNPVEDLEAVDVPTLLVSGTEDITTPIDPDTERAWDSIAGRPLWRVDVTDAGHQSFTDVCDYQELLPTLEAPELLVDAVDEFAEEGCTDELVPIDEAHRLINRASVAFLLAYVAGETGYTAFLAEELPGEVVQVKE